MPNFLEDLQVRTLEDIGNHLTVGGIVDGSRFKSLLDGVTRAATLGELPDKFCLPVFEALKRGEKHIELILVYESIDKMPKSHRVRSLALSLGCAHTKVLTMPVEDMFSFIVNRVDKLKEELAKTSAGGILEGLPKDKTEECGCDQPFRGVRFPSSNDEPATAGFAVVERCDNCSVLSSDEEAADVVIQMLENFCLVQKGIYTIGSIGAHVVLACQDKNITFEHGEALEKLAELQLHYGPNTLKKK